MCVYVLLMGLFHSSSCLCLNSSPVFTGGVALQSSVLSFFFFYFVFPLQSAEFLGSHFTENVFGHSGWFSVPVEATSLHCCATDSSPQKRFTQNLLPRIPSLKLASHGTADTWCYIKKMCWFSLKISKSENQCKMFPLCIFSNFLIPKVSKK